MKFHHLAFGETFDPGPREVFGHRFDPVIRVEDAFDQWISRIGSWLQGYGQYGLKVVYGDVKWRHLKEYWFSTLPYIDEPQLFRIERAAGGELKRFGSKRVDYAQLGIQKLFLTLRDYEAKGEPPQVDDPEKLKTRFVQELTADLNSRELPAPMRSLWETVQDPAYGLFGDSSYWVYDPNERYEKAGSDGWVMLKEHGPYG